MRIAAGGLAQVPECGRRRGRLRLQLSPRVCERRRNPNLAESRIRAEATEERKYDDPAAKVGSFAAHRNRNEPASIRHDVGFSFLPSTVAIMDFKRGPRALLFQITIRSHLAAGAS